MISVIHILAGRCIGLRSAGTVALVALLWLASFSRILPNNPGYPVKVFLGQTSIAEVAVSPGGRQIAFVTSRDDFDNNVQQIALHRIDLDASGNKTRDVKLLEGPDDISTLKWSPDGRYLAFISSAGPAHSSQVFVIDSGAHASAESERPVPVTDQDRLKTGVSDYDWFPDSVSILFAARDLPGAERQKALKEMYGDAQRFPSDPPHTTLYRQEIGDVSKRICQPVISFQGSTNELRVSPDGKQVAYITGTTKTSEIEVHLGSIDGTGTHRQLTHNFVVESRVQWGKDGRHLYVTAIGDPGLRTTNYTQMRLDRVDIKDGQIENIGDRFGGGFGTASSAGYVQLADGNILSMGVLSTAVELYLVDPKSHIAKQVTHNRGTIANLSASSDGNTFAFVLSDKNSFQEIYVARGVSSLDAARRTTDFNSELGKYPPPEIRTIRWQNGEGDTVEGVLYVPPGSKPADKSMPLIVDLHGGPWSLRTEALTVGDLSYDYYAALLASRGYLVLQPNFRGSPGRGDAFLKALESHSCSRPSADVLSGVDSLVSAGLADQNRMGIIGASFGGELVNCLIGRTTRFKAACSSSGVYNDISYFGTADNSIQNEVRDSNKAPWEDFRTYWEESPISRAGSIKTPTLVIIGGADRRVPTLQAHELYRALVYAGVPSELLVFPGEGHIFNKPLHRLTKVERELSWIDHYVSGLPLQDAS